MAFSFTISAQEVNTLKGTSGNPSFEAVADRGLGRQSQHRVLTSKFGDGYEQRVRDGINTKDETFNISFNNRSADEINLIAAYLDSKAGLNFTLTITNLTGNEAIKVVCDTYNISYIQETVHSLQTTFRRVYEP